MGIELLLNDYYDLLRLLQRNEAIILDEKVIPLTQMQIAKSMGLSKMKINSMFKFLVRVSKPAIKKARFVTEVVFRKNNSYLIALAVI
ncbi:MAG: hypothetical protein R3Y67_02230 [Eubacteriales bacterium]